MKVKEISVIGSMKINIGKPNGRGQINETCEYHVGITADCEHETFSSDIAYLQSTVRDLLNGHITEISANSDDAVTRYIESRTKTIVDGIQLPASQDDDIPMVRSATPSFANVTNFDSDSDVANLDGGIGQLRVGAENTNFRGVVTAAEGKRGEKGPELTLTLSDRSGTIKIPIWEKAGRYSIGDVVDVASCYKIDDYKGTLTAKLGKGRLTKVQG